MSDYSQAPNAEAKDRILAGLIDVLVVGTATGLLGYFLNSGGLETILWLAYCLTRDNLLNGGIGKQAMKLAVVKEDGTSVKGDWGVSIMHNLLVALNLWIVEIIAVLATGQSVGQRIAKTRVVKIG